jgi:hypothetical protein
MTDDQFWRSLLLPILVAALSPGYIILLNRLWDWATGKTIGERSRRRDVAAASLRYASEQVSSGRRTRSGGAAE